MNWLENKIQNRRLVPQLEIASGFFARGKGLLGRHELAADAGLWILHCNSIHTFFMKFTIDCVFVDKKLRVKAIRANVVPQRLVLPIWGASSVIELPAGASSRLNIQVGDQLHVGG